MKINKAAAIPLITVDPYFSVWSKYDQLNMGQTTHWCGKSQTINGYVKVGKEVYCFLGENGILPKIQQTALDVTATSTQVEFENEKIQFTVKFTTPLLLDDIYLVSRPSSYIDIKITKTPAEEVSFHFTAEADLVRSDSTPVCGGINKLGEINYGMMGKTLQTPLGGSGDNVTINWGYLYLATTDGTISFNKDKLIAEINPKDKSELSLVIAYDDLMSINYFGEFYRGLWTKKYSSILEVIQASINEHDEIMARCEKIDCEIQEKAESIGGKDYAFICNMSYRHSISAHKLIEDNKGRIIFLSKENDSNGCLGTSDISYPSVPLYLLYDTEYVKGMIRPIMDFAVCDVWEYDFAPHDVGRYPYAWGQVYGVKAHSETMDLGCGWSFSGDNIFPPYYQFPKGSDIYEHKYQMPVEESGNMIIMIYNVCRLDKSPDFAREYLDTIKIWVNYLIKYGSDPGEQLCTDDFAGHLAHNVNLSIKAIMGIEAFALLSKDLGNDEDYNKYHNAAKDMAKDCEARANANDHTRLTYDNENSWSLKYNLVWDKIWGTELFSSNMADKEIDYYITKINEFGTPLDSRQDYTKSDWILWCTAMADDKEKRQKLIAPVAHYLENTVSRVPFSDWYNTKTSIYEAFIARSVQGGIFMPMLYDEMK